MENQDIENVILFQIDKTSKISKQYSQREFDQKKLGITIEQWILLKIIEETQPISQRELADKSLRDPASITRTLDILEKKQFIQRKPIPNNRRQYHIELTIQGNTFVKNNMKMIKAHRRKSIEGLSPEEIESLRTILLKIQKNMS